MLVSNSTKAIIIHLNAYQSLHYLKVVLLLKRLLSRRYNNRHFYKMQHTFANRLRDRICWAPVSNPKTVLLLGNTIYLYFWVSDWPNACFTTKTKSCNHFGGNLKWQSLEWLWHGAKLLFSAAWNQQSNF